MDKQMMKQAIMSRRARALDTTEVEEGGEPMNSSSPLHEALQAHAEGESPEYEHDEVEQGDHERRGEEDLAPETHESTARKIKEGLMDSDAEPSSDTNEPYNKEILHADAQGVPEHGKFPEGGVKNALLAHEGPEGTLKSKVVMAIKNAKSSMNKKSMKG